MIRSVFLLALIAGGCVYTEEIEQLPSGKLQCSDTGQCPAGNHCACDDRCWRIGELPSCESGTRDGTETDVDCGGPCCPPCAEGRMCAEARDCESRVCKAGRCAKNTCSDGVKNGAESDVDCGYRCPVDRRCAAGRACSRDSDCAPPMRCVQGGCQ